MLVVFLICFTSHLCRSQELLIKDNQDLTACIQNVITYSFKKGSQVTYVDIDFNDNDIIKAVHEMNFVSVITRTTRKKVLFQNEAYLLIAKNFQVYKERFEFLMKEKGWKPDVYFLIVFMKLEVSQLNDVFRILLHHHIFQAVVINGTNCADVFTYNPFENYGCGFVFNRIISHGKCFEANITQLYFNKLITGLKKCRFRAAVSHAPPYTFDPRKADVKLMGTEQYVMQILSELEEFKINYTYKEDSEEFSVINNDMIASGPLSSIQNENVDMLFGGSLLLSKRIQAFSHFHGHLAFTDELKIFVKKADYVSNLKNIYIEFDTIVWMLLAATFAIVFALVTILFRIKQKCEMILVMWDLLFQHNSRFGRKINVKYFIFIWVIFAFLINVYYQSNLMGLTTHPSHNYQISNENDLVTFKIKPCLSLLIRKYIQAVTQQEYVQKNSEECQSLLQSIKTVSHHYDKYTIMVNSLYMHNILKFIDEFGDSQLYSFKKPITKIMYGVYFYKGFPMVGKLHSHTLRMRENGLIEKHFGDILQEATKRYNFNKQRYQARFIIPWPVLLFGMVLATVCFVLELTIKYIRKIRIDGLFLHAKLKILNPKT